MAQRTKKAIGSLTMKEFLQEVQFEMEVREGERKFQVPSTVQHTSSLAASTSSRPGRTGNTTWKQKTKQCPFCKGQHYPTHCFKVPDHHARKKIIDSQHLCQICLFSKHKLDQCQQAKRSSCYICKGQHHSALHGCFEKAAKGAQ